MAAAASCRHAVLTVHGAFDETRVKTSNRFSQCITAINGT